MNEIILTIILGILCIAMLVERYLFAKQMNEKLSECIRAVMSRNINDFITATSADKQTAKVEFTQNENILIDEATDDMFDKFIGNQNK